jgi:membrane dipeptidase
MADAGDGVRSRPRRPAPTAHVGARRTRQRSTAGDCSGSLEYEDRRADPAAWARDLGISQEAVEVYLACEVVDLHVVSFVWPLPRYDLARRHRPRLPHSAFLNQVDLPRAREAQLAGVCSDIPTNPFRHATRRAQATRRNIAYIIETLARFPEEYAFARTLSEFRAARARGLTASFIALQGGDAIDNSPDDVASVADVIQRVTLVELTESRIGVPNRKRRRSHIGLSPLGREFVSQLQDHQILVDLSHLNRQGFFDALEVADPATPVVVTHTGVSALRPLWRNIDDGQIKAIAERGGTTGVVFHPHYLAPGFSCPLACVVDHLEHLVRVAGDDFASLGSDFDGMISLPRDPGDVTELPRLVALMLERKWSPDRIAKILGNNYLRVLSAVCP